MRLSHIEAERWSPSPRNQGPHYNGGLIVEILVFLYLYCSTLHCCFQKSSIILNSAGDVDWSFFFVENTKIDKIGNSRPKRLQIIFEGY